MTSERVGLEQGENLLCPKAQQDMITMTPAEDTISPGLGHDLDPSPVLFAIKRVLSVQRFWCLAGIFLRLLAYVLIY